MKISRVVTGFLAVALMVLMVSDSFAQERRGGGPPGGFQGRRGPGGGPGFGGFGGRGGSDMMKFGLLRMEQVQTELEISPQQKEALEKLAEQGREDRPDFGGIRDMSESERSAFFEKMRKDAEERAAEMKAQLEEVLLPQQSDRLDEIALQVRGIQALEDEDVASKLKITETQKQKMGEVRESMGEKMREQMRAMFQGGGRPDREAMEKARADMEKLRGDIEKEVLAVLSSDQQKQFEEMKGEKFEMPEGFGRFGGPGGPGGGGFGRGGRGGPDGGQGGPGGRRERGGRPEAE
jgi:hypothetical protein